MLSGIAAIRNHPWMRDCGDTHINSWDRPERIVALHKAGLQRVSWMEEFPSVDPVAPYHAPEQRQRQQTLHVGSAGAAKAGARIRISPFHVFSSSTHRPLPAGAGDMSCNASANLLAPHADAQADAPLAPPPPPAATAAAVPNDLVGKEELRRALLLHLQAPAVSESQQAMFKK